MGKACQLYGGGEKKNAYMVLVRESIERRLLVKPRYKWENNIKTELKKTGWKGVDWINVAQDRDTWQAVVNTVMNHWASALNCACETSPLLTKSMRGLMCK
jgi:hypothetical protein